MNARASFLIVALLPQLALAQVDEWSSFPGGSTPPPPPAPAPAARPPAAEESNTSPVVSEKESFVPGTEPHSPSTLGTAWNDRANHRLTPGMSGSIGLHRVSSAQIGQGGILRLSVFGDYVSQQDFPVLGARDVRSGGNFAASYAATPWLEAFVAYGASANSNTMSSPNLIQALGDVTLGLKAAHRWAPGFYAGVDLRALSYSAVGNQDVNNSAFGFSPRLVTTLDLSEWNAAIPLRFHLNGGMIYDQTGKLVSRTLNASEQYALGINDYNRFIGGAGLEMPMTAITPYVEYNVGVPLGVSNGMLTSPDGQTITVSQAMPQTLGVGAKITAVRDLTFNLGADLGLAQKVGLGVPATAPVNFFLGAAFNIDPFARTSSRIVERVREQKADEKVAEVKSSKVEGVVVDAQTKKPIPGAIVSAVGADLPPVATDVAGGHFLTHDLPAGMAKLAISREGYKEVTLDVMVEAGKTATLQIALESKAHLSHFAITVLGAKKKPVAAKVTFKGPADNSVDLAADAAAPSKLDVPPGRYVVNVVSDDHLAQTREVQISEGAEMKLAFELEPQPRKKLVVVKEDRIEILQPVHFATGNATIMADSYNLLSQVVDAVVKSNVKRIRVGGHTDNKGMPAKNQKLSEDRARAVAEFLVQKGIDVSRVESAGYGANEPIAPNLTARGRELNRRVEFVILDR